MTSLARRTNRFPSLFGDFDLLDDVFSRWPTISHHTVSSRFSSYEDENGYTMQVTLPEGTTADKIKAEVKDGTLTLTIEKPQTPSETIEVTTSDEDTSTE